MLDYQNEIDKYNSVFVYILLFCIAIGILTLIISLIFKNKRDNIITLLWISIIVFCIAFLVYSLTYLFRPDHVEYVMNRFTHFRN